MPDILSLSLEGRCNMEATWQLGPQGYTFHWVMIERLLLVVKKTKLINKNLWRLIDMSSRASPACHAWLLWDANGSGDPVI